MTHGRAVEQPEPFVARVQGPDGVYVMTFSQNHDEGEFEVRLGSVELTWHVEVCKRVAGGWELSGLTHGTQQLWGETYWFTFFTHGPARVEFSIHRPVRTDVVIEQRPA